MSLLPKRPRSPSFTSDATCPEAAVRVTPGTTFHLRFAKRRRREGSFTPDTAICDRTTAATPTRADVVHSTAKFHAWIKETTVAPYGTAATGLHDSVVRVLSNSGWVLYYIVPATADNVDDILVSCSCDLLLPIEATALCVTRVPRYAICFDLFFVCLDQPRVVLILPDMGCDADSR